MQKFIVRVESEEKRFSDKMEGECYALNAALDEEYCREFVENAAAESRIVLFYGEGAVKTAVHLGADGVILDLGVEGLKEKMAAVRKELGKSGVVGLFTRNRRHESMIVSEAEPDFVVFKVWKDGFESVRELTDWYNDFFLIQSAAWIMEDGVPTEELRTDFVIK